MKCSLYKNIYKNTLTVHDHLFVFIQTVRVLFTLCKYKVC